MSSGKKEEGGRPTPQSFAGLSNRVAERFQGLFDRTTGLPDVSVTIVFEKEARYCIQSFAQRAGFHRYLTGESGATLILLWKEYCLSEGLYYGKKKTV